MKKLTVISSKRAFFVVPEIFIFFESAKNYCAYLRLTPEQKFVVFTGMSSKFLLLVVSNLEVFHDKAKGGSKGSFLSEIGAV